MNGGGDVFKVIKLLQKMKKTVPDRIDGVKDEIPGHFRSIYKEL